MKTKTAVLNGKPDAGNPHVRFDEGEVASAKPRRGSLLYSIWGKIFFCLAISVASAGSWAYDAHSYVRRGLIAQWDGIDNAGTGVHDETATSWTDLVGTRNLTINSGATFQGGNCLQRLDKAPTDSRMAYVSGAISNVKTVEIVLKRKEYAQYAVLISCQGHATGMLAMKNDAVGSNPGGGYKTAYDVCHCADTTLALCIDTNEIFANGVVCSSSTEKEGFANGMTTDFALGGRAASASNPFYGSVYAVRLYDRELKEEEIKWNASVDDFRFFGGREKGGSLTVTGDPADYGSPTPEYGTRTELTPGDAFACTVPSPVEGPDGISVKCVGYLLETNAVGSAEAWCEWRGGSGNSLSYEHPDQRGVRLTWLWSVQGELGAMAPVVRNVAHCNADFEVVVTGLGDFASATLRLEYGTSAASLDKRVDLPAAVVRSGTYRFAVDGLLPDTAYFARAVLEPGSARCATEVTSFQTERINERMLPQGYRTLEFLQSSGNQYIDTGILGGGQVRCLADMMWVGSNADKSFLGAFGGGARYYLAHTANNYWFIGYKDGHGNLGKTPIDTRVHVDSSLGPGRQTFVVDDTTLYDGTVADSVDTGRNLYLFAINNDGTAKNMATARCYSLKIWQGDELKRDFVPCLLHEGNVPGLYDHISRGFFTAGDAAFAEQTAVYGRDIYDARVRNEQLTLKLSSAAEDSSLYCVYGRTYGGEDPALWGACEACGTVAKDDETVVMPVPQGCGRENSVFRAFLVTGGVTNWSSTVACDKRFFRRGYILIFK